MPLSGFRMTDVTVELLEVYDLFIICFHPSQEQWSCQRTTWCFIGNKPVANPWSLHHVTEEIFCKYQQLCIRGFLVHGILLLDYPAIAEARRMVEDVGLIYTVLHVRPICPRVVTEFISNLCSADDRVYIRGCRFDFGPVVINQQFMTPFVEKSHVWEDEDLTQAIVFLTVDACGNRNLHHRFPLN